MFVFEIVLLGAELSADAMSVTIANMLANPRMTRVGALAMPVAFGLFQGLMPVLGFFAGSLAADFIERYSGVIAFAILGVIGVKMAWDGLHDEVAGKEPSEHRGNRSGGLLGKGVEEPSGTAKRVHGEALVRPSDSAGPAQPRGVGVAALLLQALATSIDAFAVGVSLAASGDPIFFDAGVIALSTFALCLLMVFVGRRFGPALGSRAQIVGGIVLVAIGLKELLF